MFQAFSTAPTTRPTGEPIHPGEDARWHKVTAWRELGTVPHSDEREALSSAKHRWGGSPVLQRMQRKEP